VRLSKITVQPTPPEIVERPRVREALGDPWDATGDCPPVVLVSAPAGHGKTVAVADWVRATPEIPTAWLSLDAWDRDEGRWWLSVITALCACPQIPADSALRRLTSPASEGHFPDGSDGTPFLATVLDALDDLPQPIRLVLDDVHEIVGHPAEQGLRDLVRYPVRGVGLVLCSRFDPPIGIDRLRLSGRLREVRVDALAFTTGDAARLFEQMSVDLAPDQVRSLVERTEGWVAALRLVASSLQTSPDPASAVQDFAGDDRSVADYVVDEVLSKLDDRERRCLEAASACSPISVDLAVALTGDQDAAEALEHVEATTGMVTAVDRRREQFRTHELLRSHVLARLRRTRWLHLRDLYRTASEWYDDQNDSAAALHYSALAGDVAGTEALVRTRAIELLARGALDTLEEPDRLLEARGQDHRARMVLALVALEHDELDRAATLAEDTGGRGDHDDANLATFRAVLWTRLALAGGHPGTARDAALRILPEAVTGAPLRTVALVTRGYAAVASETDRACVDAEKARTLGERHGWPYVVAQARTVLALAHAHRDELGPAVEHAQAVLEATTREGWRRSPWSAGALVVLATADLLGGRPEHALADVVRAEALTATHHLEHRHALEVLRGTAEHDTGRELDGWHRLRACRARRSGDDLDIRQVAVAALLEQEMALGLGRMREAAELVRAVAPSVDGTGDGVVLGARELWATRRDAGARRLLGPALDGARPFVTALAAMEALLLDAEIHLVLGAHPVVRRRVHDALVRASEHGVVRPLVRAAPVLHRYLAEQRGSFGELDGMVDRVLAVAPSAERPVAPLTEREREVLELLPSMRSVVEIAADLAVSANTVKTHQRAIYHKLGADNRRAAVLRARNIGLLSGPP
jgi:LuxR family transcriptional regulator, maltose regulon positive regulatory protein